MKYPEVIYFFNGRFGNIRYNIKYNKQLLELIKDDTGINVNVLSQTQITIYSSLQFSMEEEMDEMARLHTGISNSLSKS